MAEEPRIYRSIEYVDIDNAKKALVRDDPAELLLVVLSVGLHSENASEAEQYCLGLAGHPHYNVRANAIQALGHLARRFRTLKLPESIEAVQRGLADPVEYVRQESDSAADDIEWYAKLPVRPPGAAI